MSLPDEVASTGVEGSHRWRPSLNHLSIAIVILVVAAGILELIPVNTYVLLPGQALRVEPLVSAKGYPPVHETGALYMTDVTIYNARHLLEELYGRLQPASEIQPAQSFSGGLSYGQYIQLNDELMSDSIHKAEAAALSAATGYKLHFKNSGPEVAFLLPGSPAEAALKSGDIIKAVDGHRTPRANDVSPLIKRVKPGAIVHLTIVRQGRLLHIAVRTIPSTNEVPAKHGKTPFIGVAVQDQIAFPVKLSITPGQIGGPSAGLMFTLALVQRLEHRDLTRGCKIAGTGTIDFNGAVGAIGGAKQKVVAAERAGAQYFLVPDTADNLGPARSAASGITVVPVKTLHGALTYLSHIKPCRP